MAKKRPIDAASAWADPFIAVGRDNAYSPYSSESRGDPAIVYFESEGNPVRFGLERPGDQQRVFVYATVRTTSWDFDGERTDLHDVLGTLFATFLRIGPPRISSQVWNQEGIVDPSEIYAMFIIPVQPIGPFLPLDREGCEAFGELLIAAHVYFRVCWEWFREEKPNRKRGTDDTGYDWQKASGWAAQISRAIDTDTDDDHTQFSHRDCPAWRYFRNCRRGVTVIKSARCAQSLRVLVEASDLWQQLSYPHGEILISQRNDRRTDNYVAQEDRALAVSIFRAVEGNDPPEPPPAIPIENRVAFLGTDHVVVFDREAGRERYAAVREHLREQYALESSLLFPPTCFQWQEEIADDDFEKLVCELLERCEGVSWVRTTSPTNQPDGRRDLVAEWWTGPLPAERVREDSRKSTLRRVVVQCKARKRSVGKSDVTDIRDTIEICDSQGFFLAVSSCLTDGLTRALEKLRSSGRYFIDWWTRIELERQLRRHPDIAKRYPSVVRPTNEA